jgi:hypothetical protein
MVSRRLAAIVAGVALGTAPKTASAASGEAVGRMTPSARIRVAVAVEREQQLPFPPEFGDHAAARSVAQGVREACLPPAGAASGTASAGCSEIGDAPGSRVCVDETLTRALAREIECSPSDASSEVIDLSLSACQTPECLQLEARGAGATHLLLVTGNWHDGLVVDGTLTSLRDGRAAPVGPGGAYNAQRPRTGPQVLAIIKWVAREAVVAELRRDRDVELAASRAIPVAPPAAASTPPTLAFAPSPSPAPGSRSSHKAIGWTLVGAGVLAGAASGWLFAIDKADSGCAPIAADPEPCSKVRRTIVPAIGVGVGAAAALVTGAVLLVGDGDRSDGSIAIALGAESIAVGGRF